MQKEKAEAEEAARSKSDTTEQSNESQSTKTRNEDSEKPFTPKETNGASTSSERKNPTSPSSSRPRHKKTRSEAAREATFASLQRALNAAVAARDQYAPGGIDSDDSVSPTTVLPPNNVNTGTYPNGERSEDSSIPWIPSQNTQESFGYDGLNSTFTSTNDSLNIHALNDQQPTSQFHPQAEEWMGHVPTPTQSFPCHRAASDAGASYNNMQFPFLQPPEVPLSRRGSSDELANTLEGIGIRSTSSHSMPQPEHGTGQLSAAPKESGKELDLAARRKRPRPAAIGTSSSGRSSGLSTRSPTRLSSTNTGQSVRQSKSAQNLNSRYAGVRKASAAQRSPLNFSFAEAGAMNSTKAEMLQPSVTSSTLAPPTPITPETLHHLLPTSPTDGYCLSAQPSAQFFPAAQTMPVNMASPPATPLPVDVMSQFPYTSMAPPMSAPAHYTTFPEYAPYEPVPLTARSWADSGSVPSPDMTFQNSCQVPQTDISSISYSPTVEQQTAGNEAFSPVGYHPKGVEMPISSGPAGDAKSNKDFFIHEFPEQQEVHRYVAQQLPSQRRRNYIFANKTPMAFGNN